MTTLNEAVLSAVSGELAKLHTCLPGQIETFDHTRARASVKPLVKRVYVGGQIFALPVIVNCPVVFPRAKNSSLTFPLLPGDGVMLCFAERSIEVFLAKGGDQIPGDRRRFSLSDAIAVPGLFPFSEQSPAPDQVSLVLQHYGAKIRMGLDGRIAIGNPAAELLDLVNQILTGLLAAVPGPVLGTFVLNTATQAQFTAIQGLLALLKGNL